MRLREFLKRLRGALGIGTLWGSIWFGGAVAILALFGPSGVNLGMALRFGFTGFMAGTAFGGALVWLYRNKEISDIGAAGFVLLGAVVAGLFFPGSPLLPALFGAAAAGITIKLARRPGETLEPGSPTDLLPKPLL